MLAFILILTACEGTTTNPENLPAWEVFFDNSENPTVDGGIIQFQPGASILLDGERVADVWALDIMDPNRAVLWSWGVATPDEGGDCTDLVSATADGFELTICGEPLTLVVGE